MQQEFKTREQLNEIQEFAAKASGGKQVDLFSLSGFNSLDKMEIMERIVQVDNQSDLILWRLAAALRSKFKSMKLYGQFLHTLENDDTYGNIVSNRPRMSRWVLYGKFCERLNITNINTIGIDKSVITELAKPKHKAIARKIFDRVKNKGYQYTEVMRMIEQESAVLTIEQHPQQPERIDYHRPTPKQIVQVEDNVAQDDYIDAISVVVEESIEHHENVLPVALNLPESNVEAISYNKIFAKQHEEVETYHEEEAKLSDFSDEDLLLELATRKVDLSDADIISEIQMISERYDKSFGEMANIGDKLVKIWRKLSV